MFTGGDGGGDGNQPTLQQILERMRKLEQDLAAERALRQMSNPRGTTVPGQGTSAPPVVPGRAARDASAIRCAQGGECVGQCSDVPNVFVQAWWIQERWDKAAQDVFHLWR